MMSIDADDLVGNCVPPNTRGGKTMNALGTGQNGASSEVPEGLEMGAPGPN